MGATVLLCSHTEGRVEGVKSQHNALREMDFSIITKPLR